jgi:hypothetical protein
MMQWLVLSAVLSATAATARDIEPPWPRHAIDNSSRGADGVRLADINGDGLLDIATGWEEGGITRAYFHPGPARSREKWPAVTVGIAPSVEDAVFADLDHDGAVDVVSCCEGKTRTMFVHWAPKDQSQRMSPAAWRQESIPVARGLMQWMFAYPIQVDGENGVDLLAGGKNQDAWIGWFQSPADPRDMNAWKWHPLSQVGWTMSIIPQDMDADGDMDILLTDRRRALRGCRWLENPGPGPALAGKWPNHFVGGQDAEVMFATVSDLDKDGLQDVLVAAKEAQVLWFRRLDNTGRRWAEVRIPFPENMGTAKGIAVGDIDLNGHPDIVVSCEGAEPPKSGVKWLSYDKSPLEPGWQGHEISGPAGVKFDRIELLDLDGDGALDVLTCEEVHNLGVIWYENPHAQTRDGRAGLGQGIMINISNARGIIPGALEQVKDNPYVAGVQVNLDWANIEPQKRQYRWDEIDRLLDQCGKAGKQVAFKFTAVSGKVMTDSQLAKGKGRAGPEVENGNDATPAWLFDDPQVRRIGGIATPKGKVPLYPVFWDQAYQKHLGDLLAAMAQRYDGDPRIEYIRMGGWQVGTNEPSFYGGAAEYLREQLAEHGEHIPAGRKARLSADSRYCEAVKAMIDLWYGSFRRTRLAATIHFPNEDSGEASFEQAMNDHCAKYRVTILNTGLNERDKAQTRKVYRQWHDTSYAKVGWGGITHLGWEENRPPAQRAPDLLLRAFRQGIGVDGDVKLTPASCVSYLVVGPDSLADTEALAWASGHLAQ